MARAKVDDAKLEIAKPKFSIDAFDEKSVMLVSDDYDATVQTLMEGFPERKWRNVNGMRGWVVPVNQPMLEYLKRTWRASEYTVSETATILMTYEELTVKVDIAKSRRRWDYLFNDVDTPFTYPAKRKPFMHQAVAVEAAYGAEYFGLLMEMGTGKTKCICDEWLNYILKQGANELLKFVVVCPKSLMTNWEREIHANIPTDLFYTSIVQLKGEVTSISTMMQAFQEPTKIKIFILSYDSAASMLDQLLVIKPTMLVCDESHYIKNSESKRFKAVRKIADVSAMRRILTGTPVSNTILDVWSQFEILRPGALGYNTFAGFKRAFCNISTDGPFEKIEGYKDIDKLKENMARMSFLVKKEQCLDLPEQLYDTKYIEMPEKLREVYKEVATNFYHQLEGGISIDTEFIIVQMLKLSQICCGFVSGKEAYMDNALTDDAAALIGLDQADIPQEERFRSKLVRLEGGDAKLNEMIDDIEELVKEGSKCIVWSRFRTDNKLIQDRLNALGIWNGIYDGSTNDRDRQDTVDAFNGDDGFKVIIANTGSGGVGLTLLGTKQCPCHTAFFYSNDFSYGKRQQAEARNHRIGQVNKVLYRDYIYEDSIEEYIAQKLQQKKDLSEAVKDVGALKEFLLNHSGQ